MYHSFGNSNARGVAILINRKTEKCMQNANVVTDSQGRLVSLNCTINAKEFTFVNVYGPNKDDNGFFTHLASHLEQVNSENIIIGGDFNLVLDTNLDCKNCIDCQPTSHKILLETIDRIGLVNVWRARNPNLEISLGIN